MVIKKDQKGFTILELMIATTVFSVMLMLASAGIIQIGRIYYKGITTNRTQEVTRSVVEDISRNYQLTGNKSYQAADGPDGVKVVCIGLTRYTYKTEQIVDATHHALWTDRLNSTGNCQPVDLAKTNPSDGDENSDNTELGKTLQREMLGRNMRLGNNFSLAKDDANDGLRISVKVIYGEKDLIMDDGTCQPMGFGGQFCAVASLDSFVKGRL